MSRGVGVVAFVALLAVVFTSRAQVASPIAKPPDVISFQREILPVLQANCLPCHNQTRAKGDLSLENREAMIKGGASGPSLVPGQPTESLMVKAAAHSSEDLVMPPAGNKVNARNLTSEELRMLSLWIEQGAPADNSEAASVDWRAIPTNWVSSFATALTSDGKTVAVARANRIVLYDTKSGRVSGTLVDPALGGAAQRDWVNALAFSPDGEFLAAAGYREVRFWRRKPVKIETATADSGTDWIPATEAVTLDDLIPGFDFKSDPRLADKLVRLEDDLALARTELARAATLITEAEASGKAADETLKKARENREAQAKTLAEREKELAIQQEAEKAASRDREQISVELQRFSEAFTNAHNALETARIAAGKAAEQDVAAQVAAAAAERLKAELNGLVAGLPAGPAGEAAEKAREAAAIASREAAARAVHSAETRAAAERAREELAQRAFAAGERKAEAARAQAELPPRIKQTEERLAASRKAISEVQPRVEKARITLEGGTQDVVLAEKSVGRAAELLAEGKSADEIARKRISAAETELAETRSLLAAATTVPVILSAKTPSGSGLLTIRQDGLGTRWDLPSDRAAATFSVAGQPLAVAPLTETEFLVRSSNAVLRVDTAREWMLERIIGAEDPSSPFVDRVNALAFSPDGSLLATGGGDPSRAGELKIWRVSDGTLVRSLDHLHSDCVMAVAFSPRGEWLASGGADRFASITSVSENKAALKLEGHTHHVLSLAWSADAGTLATAGAEGVVKLWNARTGERRKNVEGFEKEVTGIHAVGATNQFVAVSGNGQARVFRTDGEKVRDLSAAAAFLQAAAIARNGNLMAAGADDGTVHLWDVPTGKALLTLRPE